MEKRKCKRYNVSDFVAVPLANRLGRLINISETGIAIQLYNEDSEALPEECKTYFLTVGKGFLIEDLPLKLVRKEIMPSSPITTVAAKFDTPNTNQLGKIRKYISGLCPKLIDL
ncbi:MAG: hypothetical protein GQ541_01580 [Desulfovibrionaceae bacterium]|nr:hypothetical protein [Desulfovibrionaceae bacterium]